jgi:hypothetical protein
MSRQLRLRLPALAAGLAVMALASPLRAATQCDTDPKRVFFQATVDPATLNKLLTRLGNKSVHSPSVNLTIPGLCVDHQIPIATGVTSLPLGNAPFTVTPSLGALRVDLDLQGPFEVGIDGGRYKAVNCDSACQIDIPYFGQILNGCEIESDIVKPILGALNANASWDDIHVTQIADTCVLGDCTAVHPLESSQASLSGFDIDLTGFGHCQFCLPDPFPNECIDPCDGVDPLLISLIRPLLEDQVNGAFIKSDGGGLLIDVFARQIVKDFGCMDIPEVKECKQNPPVAAMPGLMRGPRDHGVNAVFYSLPLGVAGVLALRRRRRSGSSAPRA